MIKIIKEGLLVYKWTCINCACEFTANSKDEEEVKDYLDNTGRYDISHRIKCPYCKETINDTWLPFSKREKITE